MHTYNDGRCSGDRRPRLYLAKGGEVRKFSGENIPEFCAIAAQAYEKNGKWSNTTYQLELASGVRPLDFLSPLHGTWGDSLPSWGAVVEELGLSLEAAKEIVRAEYPNTAKRLDDLEEFALATESQGCETEVVIISFGSPTNRASREGYWEKPKSGQTSDGRTVTIRPGSMEAAKAEKQAKEWGERCNYAADSPEVEKFAHSLEARVDWESPEVIEPLGAKVLSAQHRPGMHGGYWTVEVAVPVEELNGRPHKRRTY